MESTSRTVKVERVPPAGNGDAEATTPGTPSRLARWSATLLSWVRPGWKPDATASTRTDTTGTSEPVKDLAKWLAGGFTLLGGLLAFFGIKEEVLDRALDQYPHAALLIFAQVGGAVVAAVAVAVLPGTVRLRAPVLAVAIAALIVVSWQVYPDIADLVPSAAVWAVVIGLTVAAVLVTFAAQITVTAFTLVLATTSLVLGMYGAAKVGVQKAGFTTDIEVAAEVTRTAGEATARLDLQVTAGGLDAGDALRVTVFDEDVARSPSTGYDPRLVLGETIVVPDLAGGIDRATTFLVPASVERGSVRVVRCEVQQAPTGTLPGGRPIDPADEELLELVHCPSYLGSPRALFAIAAGDPVVAPTTTVAADPSPTLTAVVGVAGADVPADVTVTARHAPAGATIDVEVTSGRATVATALLHVGDDGAIDWSLPVDSTPGVRLEVTATLAAPGADPLVASATYVPPTSVPAADPPTP